MLQNESSQPDPAAPTLYLLDTGLGSDVARVWKGGRVLVGSGDGKTPLRTLVEDQPIPDGIALCPSVGRIVWTNMGIPWVNDGHLMSCNFDGSDVRTIVPPGVVHTPKQLTFEPASAKLYFSDREGLRVLRCNADGSGLETLVQTGDWQKDGFADMMLWCIGIAVAPRQGKFYWTQKGPSKAGKGRLFRASITMPSGCDATNRTDIECVASNLPEPIDIDVDEESDALYWVDRGELPFGNALNRASLTLPLLAEGEEQDGVGGRFRCHGHELMARNLHEGIGIALDKKNRHVYVTDLGGTVYRFDMDGAKNKKKMYEDLGVYTGIALLSN